MKTYTAQFASYEEYKNAVNDPLMALDIISYARESGYDAIRFQIPAHADGESIASEPWQLNSARAVLVERHLPKLDQFCVSDDEV
jgi:hypothetical protein